MDEATTEVTAFTGFLGVLAQDLVYKSLERANEELKRCARAVGVFHNPATVIRHVGAVLANVHDEWRTGDSRFLSEGSMALLDPTATLVCSPRSAASGDPGSSRARHPGSSAAADAADLFVSERKVERHLDGMCTRLDIRCRA